MRAKIDTISRDLNILSYVEVDKNNTVVFAYGYGNIKGEIPDYYEVGDIVEIDWRDNNTPYIKQWGLK